jgi:hypothetical protein
LDILGATFEEAGTTYPFEPHEFTLMFLVWLIFTLSLVSCVKVVPASSKVAPNISKERRHTITGETTFECYWKHTESMDNDQSNFTFAAVGI